MPTRQMTAESAYHSGIRYAHSQTLTDATSDPIAIPATGREVLVGVVPGVAGLATSPTVTVEYTLSPIAEVDGGTATWHEWAAGAAAEATTDTFSAAISAVRFTSVGEGKCEVAV